MPKPDSTVLKIISGGQTGIDRQALDLAIELDLPHGGWCPRGRIAEDGRIPRKYRLRETDSHRYHVRTEQNVIDSDGTLVLHSGPLTAGTALTVRLAKKHFKPLLRLNFTGSAEDQTQSFLEQPDNSLDPTERFLARTLTWIQQHQISELNIAGPRLSSAPGLPLAVRPFLLSLFQRRVLDPCSVQWT